MVVKQFYGYLYFYEKPVILKRNMFMLVAILKMQLCIVTLVNVNAPVVATTSWWLHFTAPVVA